MTIDAIRKLLLAVDCNKHTETKGKFTYLSWAWAVQIINDLVPEATWRYVKDAEGNFSHKDRTGYFVETSVSMAGVTINEVLPVLDFKNNPIKEPTAFHVNTSLKRCLTKNFAMFGLGLYIYAGEDTAYFIGGKEPVKKAKAKATKSEERTTPNVFKDGDSQSGFEDVSLEELVNRIGEYKEMRSQVLDVKEVKLLSELVILFPEVSAVANELGIESQKPKDLQPNEIGPFNAKLIEIMNAKNALVKQAKADQERKKAEAESDTAPVSDADVYDK
jgi:hypothetical protein